MGSQAEGNSADKNAKEDFLFPRHPYRGDFSPEHLAFNANLQEFAGRVSLICNLETGGKITSREAYNQIKQLWKDLKASKKNLLKNEPDNPQ